ncbi:substrate-binding domain-containing protein [Paucilactobacillus wasatchensis]|uniref:Ribose ABC transport system, periplasmic ribose-binding protein n=1 Tax=Paucilactobacillus wasatchensis TaxID=1335616 RepID=A0A0D1A7V6_9LACO|nr:substrate-binding domain-containing protein [Paucilactobacillus wasatchensis]KIS03802.1 Ribose ABC transport system, periplasmic ribose-binding protein [Paucilactobacillus wasatchensis]
MKKSTKRLLSLFTVFSAFLMVVSGCGAASVGNNKSSSKVTKKAAKNVKIGVSLSTLSNPFFVNVKKGIDNEAKANGSKVETFDAQNDSSKQNNQISDLITKKVDVIIVNPVDSDAIVPSVKKANQAGIPVIACDRGSNGGKVVTTVASDNVKAGKMAAQFLADQVGSNAKVAELEGTPGADAAVQRGKGFDAAIKGNLDLVTKQSANFDRAKGLSTMQNILQAHSDIKGVFAQNDEMALGAAKAIKNQDIKIVSIDGTPDGLAAVKSGQIDGIVAQQPKTEGKLAVKAAYKYYQGKKVSKTTASPIHLVKSSDAK